MQNMNASYEASRERLYVLSGSGGIAGNRTAAGEHSECGTTAFYPLSPVQMSLYYSQLPEAEIA